MTLGPFTRGALEHAEARGWVLAALLAAAGTVCLLLQVPATVESIAPSLPDLPGGLATIRTVGVALLALAPVAALARRSPTVLWAGVLAAVLLSGTVLATTTTVAAAVTVSAGFTYFSLYAAYAFDRGRANAVLLVAVATSLVGSALSGAGLRPLLWLVTTGGTVLAAAFVGHTLHGLRWYATTDDLTEVMTRGAFESAVRTALAGGRRRGAPSVLVLLDLDDFKSVNDTLGHAAGDAVLVAIVTAWRARLRGQDLLGRIGGDEFAMLLPDTDLEGASRVVDDLAYLSPADFSAGLALAGPDDDVAGLLRRADAGMYAVKRRRPEPASR